MTQFVVDFVVNCLMVNLGIYIGYRMRGRRRK